VEYVKDRLNTHVKVKGTSGQANNVERLLEKFLPAVDTGVTNDIRTFITALNTIDSSQHNVSYHLWTNC
jgi:hypothetical protein